jgi:hypothetical protein
MSVPAVKIYPRSATFNTVAWDKSSGGPTMVEAYEGGSPLEVRSGDAFYPTSTVPTEGTSRVTLRLLDASVRPTVGTKSTFIVVGSLGSSDAAVQTHTFINMVYMGVSMSIHRAAPNEVELNFHYESADGTTKSETVT